MTARQLLEWSIFAELEPFGEDREDARFGSVVQILANAHRDSKKRRQPYSIYECTLDGGDMPTPQEVAVAKPPTTWEKMKVTALQWMEQAGQSVDQSKKEG